MADRSSLILRLDSMFTFSLSDISQEFKHFGRDSIESVRQAIDCTNAHEEFAGAGYCSPSTNMDLRHIHIVLVQLL